MQATGAEGLQQPQQGGSDSTAPGMRGPIGYQGSRYAQFAKNHTSAINRPYIVQNLLNEEVNLGRVAGPFLSPPMQNLRISPLGLVEKSTKGKFRLIFDLSHPHGASVNDGISDEFSTVQYSSFDDLASMVNRLGKGSWLVKLDIKSAFRLLPVHPEDYDLLGMCFNGKYFIDKAVPFGCRSSCALFEQFSTFLEWSLKNSANTSNIIHYLDDFCGGQESYDLAQSTLGSMLGTLENLGVPIAQEKVEGPTNSLQYLGLVVNTQTMEITLPTNKIEDLKYHINICLSKRSKVTLRELQSLIGKLNFACRAVSPGRPFCRRLIDATMGVKQPFHRIRITNAMKEDLKIWLSFLNSFNGSCLILPDSWLDNSDLQLFTDASGSLGFGAYCQGHWAHGKWPANWQDGGPDITYKELFPIVVAIELWGSQLANKRVLFRCDNQAVVTILNKQSTRSKLSMNILRKFVLACLTHNIRFKAKHIPGAKNGIADALSRGQLVRFRTLAPDADCLPTPLPTLLLEQLHVK